MHLKICVCVVRRIDLTESTTQLSLIFLLDLSFSSYLLGLLAKIKCSISSSQPDLWDLEYISSIIWLGTFMKPSDLILLWSPRSPLCSACRQTSCASKRDLGIAVPPRVAGTPSIHHFPRNKSNDHSTHIDVISWFHFSSINSFEISHTNGQLMRGTAATNRQPADLASGARE